MRSEKARMLLGNFSHRLIDDMMPYQNQNGMGVFPPTEQLCSDVHNYFLFDEPPDGYVW